MRRIFRASGGWLIATIGDSSLHNGQNRVKVAPRRTEVPTALPW